MAQRMIKNMKERIIKNSRNERAEYEDGPIWCQENLPALPYQKLTDSGADFSPRGE
jgi:hypothetical protein